MLEVSHPASGSPGLTFRPGSQSSSWPVLGISQHLLARGPSGQLFEGEQPGPWPPRPPPRTGRGPLFPELERTVSFLVALGREAQGREGGARATPIRRGHAEFGRSLLGTAAAVTAAAPRQAQLLSVFCSPRLRARKAEASGLRALRAGPRSLSFAPDSCTVAGMGDTLGRRCPVSACVLRAAPPAAVFPTWLLCRGTLDPGKEAGGTPPAAPRLPDAGRTGRPSPLRLRGRREREGAQSVPPEPALCGPAPSSCQAPLAFRGHVSQGLRPPDTEGIGGPATPPVVRRSCFDRRSPSSSVLGRVPAAVAGSRVPSFPAGVTGWHGGPSIEGTV